MYVVKFNYKGKLELPFSETFVVSDLERALALASLLQKISTDVVGFDRIIVEPFKIEDHETEKK